MITHMTFDRHPTIGRLHRVALYDDKGVPVSEHLAELSMIVSARRDVCFVHLRGGKRPTKTYRRPTKRAADGGDSPAQQALFNPEVGEAHGADTTPPAAR